MHVAGSTTRTQMLTIAGAVRRADHRRRGRVAVFARYFRLWIQSVTTGARIGIFDLLGMTFRKVNPDGHRPQQDHGRAGRA